jgi:hypothetical protein
VLVYIEYISRRPGVSVESFHDVIGRMQQGWADEFGDDRLLLSVGRTWRTGPEPEYLCVWYTPKGGLERIDEWERVFASGEVDAIEEPFRLAARIDRAGCYEPLVEPGGTGRGRYYAEFFDFVPEATHDDVRAFFADRCRRHPDLELTLLLDRIGKLGPDPRALAFWSLPAYGALDAIARELDGVDWPVRLVTAGLYATFGEEVL